MTETPAALTPPINRTTVPWPPAISLDVAPQSAALARRFVRDVVSGHPADAYAVALVTSELVTNAMRAAARVGRADATITLSLAVTDRWTHLRVSDPSPVPPTRRTATADDESGRGMTVIDACTATPIWTTHGPVGGKTVHAVIAAPGVTLPPGELARLRASA